VFWTRFYKMLTTAFVDGNKIHISQYNKPENDNDPSQYPRCPAGHRLIAKKGAIKLHHFAHYQNENCMAKGKMTNWHAQFQAIVLDIQNLEVCLSREGLIIGHSSFHGQQSFQTNLNAQLDGHIADIIKPSPPGFRHLVVELQHSSINAADVKEREAYYQHMIWVFDFTPRTVPKGKHNKISMVDGTLTYLKDKVRYLAFISSRSPRAVFPANDNFYLGDQSLTDQPTPIGGAFVIATTKTKYWFEATKVSYFDSGFGILRLLHRLDNNCSLYMLLSYEDFFRERMPPLNQEKLKSCAWFHSIDHMDLIKMGIMPKCIDIPEILICKERVIFRSSGIELDGLGLEKGIDEWHWGVHYEKAKQAELKAMAATPGSNDSVLLGWINQAKAGRVLDPHAPTTEQSKTDAMLATKLRHFLGSSGLDIEIVAKKGGDVVVVYCDHTTYGLKDKFVALGMTYRKGKNVPKAVSSRQAVKKTSMNLADMVRSAQQINASRDNDNNEPIHAFHRVFGDSKAEGAAKNNESRTHYRGKVKDVQARVNSALS
jgi:hypothetical protein